MHYHSNSFHPVRPKRENIPADPVRTEFTLVLRGIDHPPIHPPTPSRYHPPHSTSLFAFCLSRFVPSAGGRFFFLPIPLPSLITLSDLSVSSFTFDVILGAGISYGVGYRSRRSVIVGLIMKVTLTPTYRLFIPNPCVPRADHD